MASTVASRTLTGNDFNVFVSEQAAKGAINANPVFTPIERLSGRGMKSLSYVQSGAVRGDRQGRSQVLDTKELTAELSLELAKQSVRFAIGAIHGTEQARTVTATDIASTATGFTSTTNGFTNFAVGDYFFVSGFANAAINTAYLVTAKANSNTVTTYPAPAANVAAGASVTVRGHKTKNGLDQTYYTLQTRAKDKSKPGEIDYLTLFDGIINTQSIEIGATGIATGSVSMLFEGETSGTSSIAGQTDAAAPTDAPVSAVSGVKDFYVNGVSQKCTVRSMTINIGNNYTGDDAAACGKQYGYGDVDISGSVSVRSPISAPLVWRDYYYNGTDASIGVRIAHSATEETIIVIRRAKVTESTIPDGSNVIANAEASFSGQYDATANSTIDIYRNWQ